MTPRAAGVVAIAVEDDAILMLHGIVEVAGDGCQHVDFAPVELLPRPLTATSDGTGPQAGQSREALRDWRENAPERVVDYVIDYVRECLDKGRQVDAIGVSMFGNVDTLHRQGISHVPGQGSRAGRMIRIDIPQKLSEFFESRNLPVPEIAIVNDATAMAVGEAIYQAEAGVARPDLFACVWLGKGVNGGVVFAEAQPWQGFMHPEMGHIMPRFHEDDETFVRWSNEAKRTASP